MNIGIVACAGSLFVIAAAFGLTSCSDDKRGSDSEISAPAAEGDEHARAHADDRADEHGHAQGDKPHGHHAPPHGGMMIELGEHVAHAEAVFDAGEGRLTVYFLDSSASGAARASSPELQANITLNKGGKELVFQTTLAGVESSLTGERAGDTSQFAAADPAWSGLELAKVEITEAVVGGITHRDLVISPETVDAD